MRLREKKRRDVRESEDVCIKMGTGCVLVRFRMRDPPPPMVRDVDICPSGIKSSRLKVIHSNPNSVVCV